jgi:hypothetical protein
MFIRQQTVGFFDAIFSYAGDEIPRFMAVTLIVALFNKRLSQLVDDARFTLCILGVTAVRNFLK